ncbi:hypothetical protein N7527_007187 [Penicillium freii]|nr:hypothetical protein N7527_007187 [Penicillium freii]
MTEDRAPSSLQKASLELHANVPSFAHRLLVDGQERFHSRCHRRPEIVILRGVRYQRQERTLVDGPEH